MPLRRRAWIIGSPGEVANMNFLPGVARDLNSYPQYLLSDEGGAWRPDEIIVCQCPSVATLQWQLACDEHIDFSMMVFTGHGYADMNGETFLCVNEQESVPILALATNAPRQLVVVDACRTFLDVGIPRRQIAVGGDFGAEPGPLYRASCRALYDQAVAMADPGLSVVFSSDIGEASTDTRRGGLFSQTLLEVARYWAERSSDSWSAKNVLDVPRAVQAVKQTLVAVPVPQSPQLENGWRYRSFPLAVA